MQKPLGHPVYAVVFAAFGLMLATMTYDLSQVGSMRLIHQDGTQEPLSHGVFVAVVTGLFSVAAVMLALAVYSAFRSIQAFRLGHLRLAAPPPPLLQPALKRRINVITFCIGVIVLLVQLVVWLWTHE